MNDLAETFDEIAVDDATRVVVLTGAGERIFCAGMDLKAFSEQRQSSGRTFDPAQTNFPKPVIAAVNGAAVGGGFELVLGCDMAVAVEHARFGLPEVKRGLLAAGGGTLLGTRIPLALALEVALTGDYLDAQKAAAWGIINRVVPPGELLDAAMSLASAVAANAPLAVQLTKRLTRRAVLDQPQHGWGAPDELRDLFASEDAKEGALAFVEKRSPNWSGH